MFGSAAQQQQPKSFFGTTGGLFGSTAPTTSTSSFTFGPPAKMTSASSGKLFNDLVYCKNYLVEYYCLN
jgi:hypothetical protein